MTTRILAIVVVWMAHAAFAGPVRYVDLREGWQLQTEGAWRMRFNHRDLLAMRHPWVPSEKGAFALAWRDVDIPDDWREPVYLSFYCSDDYHTDTWRPDGSWLTASGFIGHRYKRILVNGDTVVWDQDVSDPSLKGESTHHRVALPVTPGQKLRLGLLVYDAVASGTELPNDFYQPGDRDVTKETDPDAARFMTHVYWGDLALVQGEAEVPPMRRPIEAKVRTVHERRWPTPPFGEGWAEEAVPFDVSVPLGLPEQGFPLRQGVPMPAGKVRDPEEVGFETEKGQRVPTQKAVLSRWPDESIRWLLVDTPVGKDTASLKMLFSKDRSSNRDGARIALSEQEAQSEGAAAAFTLRLGEPVGPLGLGVAGTRLTLLANGERIGASAINVWAEDEGPFRASAAAEGHFEGPDSQRGSFTVKATAYDGLPLIGLRVAFVNDTPENLLISGLRLALELDETPATWRTPSGEVTGDVTLRQLDAAARTLNGEETPSDGPAFLGWPGGSVTVKHFRERFPKSLSGRGNVVEIDLIAAGDAPLAVTPGEALTHDIWLAPGSVDPAQLAATVHRPPVLENPAYYCATGVIGRARTHDGVPKLPSRMAEIYGGKSWGELGQHYGLRDFPDSPYLGNPEAWSNNYYERMLNLWSEWFMGGGRAWYDRATAMSRHILDTAVVHAPVPGKDWLGAIHGPGPNHVAGPWNPTLRAAGLNLFHMVTGDAAAQVAFLGAGEFCLRTDAGVDGGSIRQQAGPFDTICDAYMETGDTAFLDNGARRVESALRQIDRRRGVWPDTHGSQVYRGNVPWMAAQMARPLYHWYHATGDVEAAQILVGLAESIICENTDWDQAGAVYGYSHNPRYAMTANYDLSILPMIFAAYEFTEDTFFLDAAKAQWQRWLQSDAMDSVLNVYWNTPWLMWCLHEYEVLEKTSEAPSEPAEP